MRFSVRESESDIGGTRARGRAPRRWRRGVADVVQMQVRHSSQSGCRNSATATATAARTAELQPAGDPVPAGSEVKPAWPSDSAPTGPPFPCPITAGSAPRSVRPSGSRKASPTPPAAPRPLARAGCDRYWRG